MGPRYKLREVHAAAAKRMVRFTVARRSVDAVLLLYEKIGRTKTVHEAEDFILDGIQLLTNRHFYKSVVQWGDAECVADVYGLLHDELPWYAKFRLNERAILEEISFHPPDRAFNTVGGILIPKGKINYEE